jgi:DNA-binding transcriptional ArsR family regulator
MIRLRMSVTDLERMRFAYSPLTEVAESLYMVHSGWIHPLYRGWFTMTREKLDRADSTVLRAVVPARGYVASLLLGGTADVTTTIEQQLQRLANCPAEQLRADLEAVWCGGDLPQAAQRLVTDSGGRRRLADALFQYWQIAIEPHWPRLRALLDADVAYRAGQLAQGGIEALMSDLHPELELAGHAIQIVGRRSSEHDLTGTGLLLIPCAFAWPHIIVDLGRSGPPSLTYGPRGIGALWETKAAVPADDGPLGALGALLGHSRAAILGYVALPRSTTEVARELGQSPPAVSAHLKILRRCGLVTSWRSGRRVLYQRTPLASSVVAASSAAAGRDPGSPVSLAVVPDAGHRAALPP